MKTKRANLPDITAEEFRLRFHYNPDTGIISSMYGKVGSMKPDNVPLGAINSIGYRQVHVCGKSYFSARLAWLYMTGTWPDKNMYMDHINGIRYDDRWGNLRCVTASVNTHNTIDTYGTRFDAISKKWHARITVDWKVKSLGYFKTKEEAIAAYQTEKIKLSIRLKVKINGESDHEII